MNIFSRSLNSLPRSLGFLACAPAIALCASSAAAQMTPPPPGALDPATTAQLQHVEPGHETAEFIWTANDAAARNPSYQAKVRGQADKTDPHYFRAHFAIASLPPAATLYLAGPRAVTVWINGVEVLRATDDGTRPKNLTVLAAEVTGALHSGDNIIAIEEVRGHSSLHTGASPTINQITYGEVLAVKIVPAAKGTDTPPLLVSNRAWRSTLRPGKDWQAPEFNDASWQRVDSLGVIGSKRDFLQWNADAGLYAWPGYNGISDTLRVFSVAPIHSTPQGDAVLLDFGREISGRLHLRSQRAEAANLTASYGESPEEAVKDKSYLGTRAILVPAHAQAFGPKSAFRYVKLTGLTGGIVADAQAITYPVSYEGSFESSDPKLNRIWETAAYTARLCMQEGIWDAPKRDRGRWMGDLDVTGRTITAVFGERELMEQTMADVVGEPPVTRDVNTIAGYSALWITGQANFYRHTGDRTYLRSMHDRLTGLLQVMEAELDPTTALFTNPGRHKIFVDWAEGFNSDTPEARAATHFEFMLAFQQAAYLLSELGDRGLAAHYEKLAARMRDSAQTALRTGDTFGNRWQTNAVATLSGAATAPQQQAIWSNVLAHVGEPGAVVTPFYGYYVLSAMAALNHRTDALDWMRRYWGGMLDQGATSFWEAYDPHWPKPDFHAYLQADNKRGYYISLAHGWSSGPAAWLIEQVLGIQPTAAGFREVTVRPDLAGLAFARGGEPTPHGTLHVDVAADALTVTVPPGTTAHILLPFAATAEHIRMNGQPLPASTLEDGRVAVTVTHAGTYTFHAR